MNKSACVPWIHIDALSYGESYLAVQYFINWLGSAPGIIFMPQGKNVYDHYILALAASSIKRIARNSGKIVLRARK